MNMPIISQFYGILIRMFKEDNPKHHQPHIHAIYNEYEASYNFDGEMLSGEIPPKQEKLIKAWIEIHREELTSLWYLAHKESEFFKIKGLE